MRTQKTGKKVRVEEEEEEEEEEGGGRRRKADRRRDHHGGVTQTTQSASNHKNAQNDEFYLKLGAARRAPQPRRSPCRMQAYRPR